MSGPPHVTNATLADLDGQHVRYPDLLPDTLPYISCAPTSLAIEVHLSDHFRSQRSVVRLLMQLPHATGSSLPLCSGYPRPFKVLSGGSRG